jgi:hypothetical protein
MTDLLVRVAATASVAGMAIVAGLVVARRNRSTQPDARVERLGFDAAVVAFTSTDCPTCRKVMRRLTALEVAVREVTFELEPGLFDEAGVDGVPLVVVLTRAGDHAAQFGGLVSAARVRRALAVAGW